MNLLKLVKPLEKDVIAQNIHKDKGTATLIQIKKDQVLKEHQSATDAMLILLSGKAVYEEKERSEGLNVVMDFVRIPKHVTHRVTGTEDTVLLLIQ